MMLDPELEAAPRASLHRLQVRRLKRQAEYCKRFKEYDRVLSGLNSARLSFESATDGEAYRAIGRRAMACSEPIYYVENTSGTTGTSKSRVVSVRDDAIDVRLLARSFACCGIEAGARVLFLDCGEPSLFGIGAKALASYGASTAVYANIRKPFGRSVVNAVRATECDTLFTVPGILHRALPQMLAHARRGLNVRRILYTGEALESEVRKTLEGLGIEVFSLYSTVELGFVGAECEYHDGVHIWSDCVLPALISAKSSRRILFRNQMSHAQFGRLSATTLLHVAKPCVNYDTGDYVYLINDKCQCGRTSPRILFVRRQADMISILNSKFTYQQIQGLVYDRDDITNLLRIELSQYGDVCKMRLVLPRESVYSQNERRLRVRHNIASFPGLGFFIEQGLLWCTIAFEKADSFAGRKLKRIVDRRHKQRQRG